MGGRPSKSNTNTARDGFAANPTVFGKILRGELPAHILHEDDQVICFNDIAPASQHHTLVIPKRHIEHSGCLQPADAPLLQHMESVALTVLQRQFPDLDVAAAHASGAISTGYHRFPFISVRHLHMHCIYPMPVPWFYPIARFLKFPHGHGFFYPSSASVRSVLDACTSADPAATVATVATASKRSSDGSRNAGGGAETDSLV